MNALRNMNLTFIFKKPYRYSLGSLDGVCGSFRPNLSSQKLDTETFRDTSETSICLTVASDIHSPVVPNLTPLI
jgi:hypothetical protein